MSWNPIMLQKKEMMNECCPVVWWYDSRYFCIFCQMAAGWTDCGWVGVVFSYLWALYRHLSLLISLMLCRWCQWCSHPLLSLPVLGHDEPCQFVMFPVRMLSIAPVLMLTRIWYQNSTCLNFLKKLTLEILVLLIIISCLLSKNRILLPSLTSY